MVISGITIGKNWINIKFWRFFMRRFI